MLRNISLIQTIRSTVFFKSVDYLQCTFLNSAIYFDDAFEVTVSNTNNP